MCVCVGGGGSKVRGREQCKERRDGGAEYKLHGNNISNYKIYCIPRNN